MNPNNWSPIELFNIGACACLLLFSIAFSTWRAFRSKTKGWLWRIYSALIWVGLVIMLYSDKFAGASSHRMPMEFVAGTWLLLAGVIATMMHGLWLLRRHTRPRPHMPVS
ncbi:hypothetical protein hmeg3_10635 [Herbaspirillum sp. meg3]|jgi:hypothetical protein|uniref:hypothetical protein n=1 Tax=Herbaspirillum sp. meg3 TaxID=2025949 RepID=UPI000B99C930|nr:hypothetical protein [Herbaspirillum sp. meg3]ASU38704.1 hypothetical protein hmeg3_10635 [Herbaspirillum sp. meg3]